MWRAMARADADLYYQQNCSAITGLMAAFARVHGRLALYCGAHDLDFVANLPLLPTARDRWLYRFGLRRMDAIAAQSPRQVESCRRDMGLDSEVIRSFYGHKGQPADPDGTVLWIARVHPTKGAELFVELARRCPERRFRLVGGGEADYFASIQALAVGVPNLELTGFVPYREVEPMFDGIAVHVSTSKFEGFPNTFLQAWSRGVPTISFFDPDAKVQGRPTGVVVADLDEMVVALRRLNDDRALWRQHSADVKHYFDQTFALDAVADQYERLFERLAATPRGRARLRN
jgi:glycosyltransferase involved in cell wall biosynthesis